MRSSQASPDAARGVAYGVAAYMMWGCFPLFFSLFRGIPAWEILIHRVIWCCVFMVMLVTVLGRWEAIKVALAHPRKLGLVVLCAVLIGANWGIFIYAVETRQVLQSSLGYFLTPLVNVALGILVLHERMTVLQGWAVALAGVGIAIQLIVLGELPWIALLLAGTFGTYGLFRKQVSLDGLSGLFVETLLLLPLGLLALVWLSWSGQSHFMDNGMQSLLLIASGVLTAFPLMAFAGAARRLRLATLGFLMYINPTMQFATALLIFKETLSGVQLLSFVLIWCSLALYSWSSWRSRAQVTVIRPG